MSKNIKLLLSVSLLVKLCLALFIPLTLDEYYYLVWGQNPQLSYFDHPPMVGWLMSIGDLFKNVAPGAIRWPFLVISHLSLVTWYYILKNHLDEKPIIYFLLVALLNPLWGAGVFIATPDIPLVLFWSLSILATLKLHERPTVLNYFALGACLGLGFLAQYQIVLFIPCLALFIFYKKALSPLPNPKIIFSILAGLIFSFPVIFWNYKNDWSSFDFQWNHGMKSTEWLWHWPIEYGLGQLLIIFPIFAWLAFRDKKDDHPLSILHCFVIFPFLFFLYSSFKSHVEANWTIMAYPSLYALAFININPKHYILVKRSLVFWSTVLLITFSLIFFSNNNEVKKLRLFEGSKFDNILVFAQENAPILPFSYQLSSYLSFQLGKEVCKFPKYGRRDFFNFKESCKTLPEHFYYVLPHGYTPPVEKDFPDYRVIEKRNIDDNYFVLEVRKR